MSEKRAQRDGDAWAKPVAHLEIAGVEPGSAGINVSGRRPTSPVHGFGRMWQKTYRIRLEGADVEPAEVIAVWKRDFPTFWPKGNRFFAPLAGIQPGEVAVLDLTMPGGLKLSTGVLVLYADEESFTLMTPEGHMFAGWITFSAFDDGGVTAAQAHVLMRASDPLYEMGMTFGGHRQEDRHWVHTLRSLAAAFGVEGDVTIENVCVDRRRQWAKAGNVWHNAGIRSGMYTAMAPMRLMTRPFRRA
ncbi:MAG TPA: hypothetical protein VLB81_14615 [Gaiellales bacterium]|nr:hypothetical protein [Gaiellales bacterium]